MRKHSIGLWCGALGLAAASGSASCSDDERPPPAGFGNVVTGGASGESGGYHPPPVNHGGKGGKGGATSGASGDGSPAGDSSGESMGGAGSGGAGGTSGKGEGGAGNLGARGGGGNETAEGGALLTGPDLECPEPQPVNGNAAPLCNPKGTWGDGELALASRMDSDFIVSVTPDELTIAWAYLIEGGGGLWVADRANLGDEFGTAQAISDPETTGAKQLAVSPNRLSLVVATGKQLLEFVRQGTAGSFQFAGTGHFSAIDLDAAGQSAILADPLFAADDTTLYYTRQTHGGEGPTLYVSTRASGDDWPVGSPIDECELNSVSSGARRPTGISADGRTLFYFDEPRNMERAAWRPAPDRPFDTFVDLASYSSAQPNAACDHLYYSAITDLGLEIFVAAAN